MLKHLKDVIGVRGPLTFYQYMRETLTNPLYGYYNTSSVIGKTSSKNQLDPPIIGDFVTSPEISSLFGESCASWYALLWEQITNTQLTKSGRIKQSVIAKGGINKFPPISYIELGPGKGTLTSTILNTWKQFPSMYSSLESVHLVERSKGMRQHQFNVLQATNPIYSEPKSSGVSGTDLISSAQNPVDISLESKNTSLDPLLTHAVLPPSKHNEKEIPIYWHDNFEEIPTWPAIDHKGNISKSDLPGETPLHFVMAHEFFDALPIHICQYVEGKGWCEVMVQWNPENEALEFGVSPAPTPASMIYMKNIKGQDGDRYEICPEALALTQQISAGISEIGGAFLCVDYGKNGPYSSSVAAISQSKFVSPLENPGQADISSWVNFGAMNQVASNYPDLVTLGPTTQGSFLVRMGIKERMMTIFNEMRGRISGTQADENTKEEAEKLLTSVKRLIEAEEMGENYKFWGAVSKKSIPEFKPYGFEDVKD